MARVSPLLYRGIEDVLHRRKEIFNSGENLNFVVVAPINGLYRVVGATYPAEHPLRQNETKLGQGFARFFFTERKVAGYVRTSGGLDLAKVESNRTVFDRAGNLIGELPPSTGDETDRWKIPVDAKWLYCRPIFEKSAANPWSNRVVGIITVRSPLDEADSLFKTAEFQNQVDSVATEVSPYLDAIQVLTGEEKL